MLITSGIAAELIMVKKNCLKYVHVLYYINFYIRFIVWAATHHIQGKHMWLTGKCMHDELTEGHKDDNGKQLKYFSPSEPKK